MRLSGYLLAVLLLLPALLNGAASELKVWLEPTNCRPGDLIELHAVLEGPDYASFELKVPTHEALYFVQQQQLPVKYNEGIYRQHSIWVLQTMHDGDFELTGILATLNNGDTSIEQTIPTQTFTVTAYPDTEDSTEPLPLPTRKRTEATAQSHALLIVLGLILLIAVLCLAFGLKRNASDAGQSKSAPPTLDDLKTHLESGEIPRELIQVLLEQDNLKLSQALRSELERVAYRPNDTTSAAELCSQLNKEAQQ